MYIQEVTYGTPLHDATVRLRYDILRKPLDMHFTVAQMEAEVDQLHIAYFSDLSEIVACLVVQIKDRHTAKIRQVAVAEKCQRQGIGSVLNNWTEDYLKQKGIRKIALNARATAAPFYARLGYSIVGELFQEVGLDHYKMVKKL